MNDLIKQIISKTGISEKDAITAISTVLSYAKEKLPPAVSTQLNDIVKGGGGGIEGNVKGLDGAFGE